MEFQSPLVRGTLVKRYKRFLADVTLDSGEAVTASCPNTGSMKGLTDPGCPVWLSLSDNPKRKYKHTFEMIEVDIGQGPVIVGINTGHPNKLVEEGILNGKIKELKGYKSLKREQKYGKNSRIDILLRKTEDEDSDRCYVEVKNVHLMRSSGVAEFPDSVTSRGAKHLVELSDMVREGHRAVMVYLIQRNDTKKFAFAGDIDPEYVATFQAARKAGVEALAYACDVTPGGIAVIRKVKIVDPQG
ncbi:MAG: DNA/RNA nuclease SfsA [Hyphomicrobiaceae bacterium]